MVFAVALACLRSVSTRAELGLFALWKSVTVFLTPCWNPRVCVSAALVQQQLGDDICLTFGDHYVLPLKIVFSTF